LGHDNGFAKTHAHGGDARARIGTHDSAYDRWCEMLMASERVTAVGHEVLAGLVFTWPTAWRIIGVARRIDRLTR